MIEAVDTAIRLLAIGALSLLLVAILAGEVRRALRWPLVGLIIGAASYLFNSSPNFSGPNPIEPWLDLISILTTFWIWIFARRLVEREAVKWVIWTVVGLMVASWAMVHFAPQTSPFGFYAIHLISLALVVDLLRIAWGGRGDDLVERRRLIRLWLPLLVAMQAAVILLFEVFLAGSASYPPPLVQLINGALIFALALFSGVALLRTDPELLVATEKSLTHPESEKGILSPSEIVLKEKLEAAMSDGFYRTPGLSITMLANHLETPEHRLRALINRRLGHRNFSAFLNRHRIAEAREILADPARVDLPILSIAMDLGYNSLPTFNRAFREETGRTPTDFRRNSIVLDADQN